MSLDVAFKAALEPLAEEIAALRKEVADLTERVEAKEHGLSRPVYDANQLKELGYSEHEAYAILRTHGHKRNGRMRVTDGNLKRYQNGLSPEGENIPPAFQRKGDTRPPALRYLPGGQPVEEAMKKARH